MSILEKLKHSKVIIVTHVFATGPAQELKEYLRDRADTLMFIGHPFLYANDIKSFFRIYKNGKIVKEKKGISWKLPEIFMYVKDILYTICWALCSKGKFDLYVGADNLNAFTGLFLRQIGKVRKVIFYTVDYVPKRFNNKILNDLYHWVDRYCVKYCDWVWNLSPRMVEERESKGVTKGKSAPQIIVPIGTHFDRIKRLPFKEITRKHTVYMGHVRCGQGVELIIESLPKVVEEVPDLKLTIIGTGPLENKLRNIVDKLGLERYVEFKGFIEDHKEVEEILTKCAVGLAPYKPNTESFTWYTDPGKPKQYLACGLPVIITRVPEIAKEIEKRPMGIAINYDKKELGDAIIRLLEDENFYNKCRENAVEFASGLSWDKIFERALAAIW